jgi:hypothetical protein
MWQQYRQTFVPTQLFVLAACATIYFTTGHETSLALAVFGVMQVAFVLSAAWTARLIERRRRRQRAPDDLPLRRHR